jgi:hypothetical protein
MTTDDNVLIIVRCLHSVNSPTPFCRTRRPAAAEQSWEDGNGAAEAGVLF